MKCLTVLAAVAIVVFHTLFANAAPLNQDLWTPRFPPAEPAAEAELVAVRCAAAQARVDSDRLAAYVEEINPAYVQVHVETIPEREEDFFKVFGYRILDGRIIAQSNPTFAARPNPESVAMAREIAQGVVQGRPQQIPVMFNGRFFTAEYDSKCQVTVAEQDDSGIRFRHRFNMCSK